MTQPVCALLLNARDLQPRNAESVQQPFDGPGFSMLVPAAIPASPCIMVSMMVRHRQ